MVCDVYGLKSVMGLSLQEQRLPRNLQYLEMTVFPILEKLPNALHTLTSLKCLLIDNCPKLASFPETGLPPMLTYLGVENYGSLETLPDGMMIKSCTLESLEIYDCPSLIRFPKGELPTTLKKLVIVDCEKLESLPEGLASNNTCFERLDVWGCPSLKSIPRGHFRSTLERLSILHCRQFKPILGKCYKISHLFVPWVYVTVQMWYLLQKRF